LRNRLTPTRGAKPRRMGEALAQPCLLLPDEDDAENAAALQRSLRRQGWQLETVDAFIAVVALRYDLVLLTSDKDFVPVPNLKQENWLMP
jgi:tRNA(fMet)-specific endonuclease VapC